MVYVGFPWKVGGAKEGKEQRDSVKWEEVMSP